VPAAPLGRRGKLPRSNSKPSRLLEEERQSSGFSQLRGPPANFTPRTRGSRSKPHARPAVARLPRGPHKALGSPTAESHRCPAPGPSVQPWSPSRCCSPPVPQQRWQLQFKCLIKASPGGGGGRAGPASPPGPGAQGAVGCAGQQADWCAPARRSSSYRDPELQPALCTWVRHYLALRLSFDWSNGAAPRPPPPSRLPRFARATDTGSRRPLKGNAAPFPRLGSAPGGPLGNPRAPCTTHLLLPLHPRPPHLLASPAPARRASEGRTRLGGVVEPQLRGTPKSRTASPRQKPGQYALGAGGSECESNAPRS
jgi:hypothetical protein